MISLVLMKIRICTALDDDSTLASAPLDDTHFYELDAEELLEKLVVAGHPAAVAVDAANEAGQGAAVEDICWRVWSAYSW